jgi:beta-aspartyl-peptidase (threonine type)
MGRVGDSPIVGSGGYADNESCAVSVTGHGESISKVNLSARVVFGVEQGVEISSSIQTALEHMKRKVGGCGGVIALTGEGRIAKGFTTERMAFGHVKGNEGEEEEEVQRRIVAEVLSHNENRGDTL